MRNLSIRSQWAIPIAILALMAAYLWLYPRRQNVREAYVSERSATLWSSLAQVRRPMATLHHGDKVAVLQRRGEQVEVRTGQGIKGWLDADLLMEPGLWQRSAQLLAQARSMPAQARGHTKVISNVRVEPGRAAPRIYQFSRDVPVEVLSRAVSEWTAPAEESQATPPSKSPSEEEQKPKREDWLLVRGLHSSGPGPGGIESFGGDSVEVAGWVLGRFVGLDLPGPVRDYASSSGMRPVAWFELNRVADAAGEKSQYLAAGVHGGEGQACDFTMIRVYTWGRKRGHYETAHVESNLCGRLPIRVTRAASGEPEFRFNAAGKRGNEERVYRLRQTVVRRVRGTEHAAAKSARKAR